VAVALLATLLPWDRFGALTGMLSAWRLGPDPWPFVAGVLLLMAAVASCLMLLRRWPTVLRYSAVLHTALSAAAAGAVGVALVRAPDFTSHTPAPYVALAGALGAALLGAIRLRRSS
jgi:MYXO-CTERM domain-containing protein